MSHRTIIVALCGLVLLLLGVVLGQNLERFRAGAAPQTSAADAAAAGVASAPVRPQAPLSTTEYWISTPEMDSTRIGYSAWAVLRPGGNLILERCRAPDYALPDRKDISVPAPMAHCEPVVDGVISRLGDGQLVVRASDGAQRTFRFSLGREGKTPSLVLDLGKRLELVPGSKNSLFDRLGRLPADEDARKRYMQRFIAGVSGSGGADGRDAR